MAADTTTAGGPDAVMNRLAEEMRRRWRRGERPLAEEFLDRHMELWEHPAAAAGLIYEEICLREEHGEAGASEEVIRRFPRWAEQLRVLLDCHFTLESDDPDFPGPGDCLGDCRLVAELGRGARGRVFLATQPALADRPVALKLTPRSGGELQALALLQHTHIVPLYAAADHPDRRLRALCMPYFGGATLADVLRQPALLGKPPRARTGADLVRALDGAQARAPIHIESGGPARDWLARAGYVEAVCWLAAGLADALQYAHERGLLHLDVKPSNILLAADGVPMLLDFHLARAPIPAGAAAPDWMGGTPAYLAPEQRAAMEAVRSRQPVAAAVDGRADVYALGLVLAEALGGRAELRARNPAVSPGLADLIARCVQPDAGDRYPTAGAVADDLRRHLADLPLRGVPNRSLGERWRKWRRRRPVWPGLAALGLAVALAAGLAAAYASRQLDKARAARAEGLDHWQVQRYEEAKAAFGRGLALAEDLPFDRGLTRDLAARLRLAERAVAARELRRAADRVRGLLLPGDGPGDDLPAVERLARELWEGRGRIIGEPGAELPPDLGQQVRADLLDLALLRADAVVRLTAPADARAARLEALRILSQADDELGPCAALGRERALHARALGLVEMAAAADRRADDAPTRTAWDHYALGRFYLRTGDLGAAARELGRAVELEPHGLWPNFARGQCAARRGDHAEAVLAFSACAALAPADANVFYLRARSLAELGRTGAALRDLDRALALCAAHAPAARLRGLLHCRAVLGYFT